MSRVAGWVSPRRQGAQTLVPWTSAANTQPERDFSPFGSSPGVVREGLVLTVSRPTALLRHNVLCLNRIGPIA